MFANSSNMNLVWIGNLCSLVESAWIYNKSKSCWYIIAAIKLSVVSESDTPINITVFFKVPWQSFLGFPIVYKSIVSSSSNICISGKLKIDIRTPTDISTLLAVLPAAFLNKLYWRQAK